MQCSSAAKQWTKACLLTLYLLQLLMCYEHPCPAALQPGLLLQPKDACWLLALLCLGLLECLHVLSNLRPWRGHPACRSMLLSL